jgi:hypothetical protein
VSGLFVAIGHDPRTELVAGQVDLDRAGYIAVVYPHRHQPATRWPLDAERYFAALAPPWCEPGSGGTRTGTTGDASIRKPLLSTTDVTQCSFRSC